MKANFRVDPDFPVIDGVGHSDKIDFFNVKGGGSTNTTFLDPLDDSLHCYFSSHVSSAVSTSLSACRFDPNLQLDEQVPSGVWHAATPDCLNSMYVGDNFGSRGSDRVLLSRIEISGSVVRFAGTDEDDFSSVACAPKCFIALVLDTQTDGAPPPATSSNVPGVVSGPFSRGNSMNSAATNALSGVPFITFGSSKRYRVLASDVIDFSLNPETAYGWVDYGESWNTVGVPPDEVTQFLTKTRYSYWRTVAIGFRFDVCLNDCLCSFSGSGHSVSDIVDNSLHLYVLNFNGDSEDGYIAHPFGSLSCQYLSRLWFSDFLAPKAVPVGPGADGDVVPEDEVPLAILADQSAVMAGDAAVSMAFDRPQKRSKASHGFYNFRPRSGDAMLFDDDPERARLSYSQRGSKADSRSRVSDRNRRAVSYRRVSDEADDPVEPFQYEPRFRDDFDGAEPPRRRGKY